MNLFFDMDGTLCEFRPNATSEDLLKEGYFASLKPQEIAGLANEYAQDNAYNTFVLSAYIVDNPFATAEKSVWLDRECPEIKASNRLFVPCGTSKALYASAFLGRPLTVADVLIDDHSANLIEWERAGGLAIKWLNGINGKGEKFKGKRARNNTELHKLLRLNDHHNYQKKYLGGSDIATLVCVGCNRNDDVNWLKTHILRFGGDGDYTAYLVDECCRIPSHYTIVAEFDYWLKIYDDTGLEFHSGDYTDAVCFRIYRAGDYGCIIQTMKKGENYA